MFGLARRSLVVLPLLVPAVCSLAQNATTSLRGVVKDPSGAIVPGATVTLLNTDTGQSLVAITQSSGEYSLAQIQPAHYRITLTMAGFAAQTKTAELLVNQPATIDFTLSVQAQAEQVNVTEQAETLNTNDASVGNSMSNVTIQALPSETRNVPDLLSLQPGVLFLPQSVDPQTQDSRSGAVNGERSDQGNVTIDGVDDNDQVNGFAFTGVLRETQDSVEEFRVITSNANSDAGRSSGAQVSLVTKSGTNHFHGALYEYNRPTFTVANDFFNKQAELNSGHPNVPGKLVRNIFGGDVGGPLKHDKLFFFFNYEGSRQAEDAQVTRTVPTAAYQQGILQYQTTSGATQALTPAQVAVLDAGCQVCTTAQYPPAPGPNPNALAYFRSVPAANGSTEGDGLNTGSFSFASPQPITLNTTLVRIDYNPNNAHRVFARGNLQKDTYAGVEQFPGQPASFERVDNSKGMVFGDTWTISPTLVNDVRYGYIRQGYGSNGVGQGDYVDFRFLDTATAETRNTTISVPVNNVIDNLTWSKGKHTLQFGGNWRLIHQNRSSNSTSFNLGSSNPYWLGGNPPDPQATLGLPGVDSGFGNSYEIAYANLVGTVPSVTDVYNYAVTSSTTGALLSDGALINRHFTTNEFEYYLQDSWRATAKLTLTFGLRHTILQTPWETKGQEVAPTIDTHAWFTERETAAQAGQIYEPDLFFTPAGHYYGKPGFYPKSKNNLAPRFAFAYAPNEKTSIRGGFGIYYEHYGQGLVNAFSQNGSFGIAAQVTNPAGAYSYETSPRFTGRQALPFNNGIGAATQTYPFEAPTNNFAITYGLDSRLKTPYSEATDFSVQHELKGGFALEATYIGRLGRHLLQDLDLAEPVDFVDPAGGGDYYRAGSQLSATVDANGGNSQAAVQAIPYFEHLFPYMASLDYPGESATQAIYTHEWAPYRAALGATTALQDIDFSCSLYYPCPANHQPIFWQDQFSSLYALSSIGMSYYNAAQLTLRHPMSHGFQADISYTYSRSIDMGSDAERAGAGGTNPTGEGASNGFFSSILNTWHPELNRAVSDFDTTHILTVDYLYQLPFGRGRAVLGHTNNLVDALLGGWQLSGIFRTTSGLPFSLNEPGWTTDYQVESYAVKTAPIKMHRHFDANGNPQLFDNPAALNSGVHSGSPIRLPYPGEAGERNNFRGDGYLDLDSGLSKTWRFAEYGALKFDWEVYNTTNTVRFDPDGFNTLGTTLTAGNLGIENTLLTTPRRMQFALRYDF